MLHKASCNPLLTSSCLCLVLTCSFPYPYRLLVSFTKSANFNVTSSSSSKISIEKLFVTYPVWLKVTVCEPITFLNLHGANPLYTLSKYTSTPRGAVTVIVCELSTFLDAALLSVDELLDESLVVEPEGLLLSQAALAAGVAVALLFTVACSFFC